MSDAYTTKVSKNPQQSSITSISMIILILSLFILSSCGIQHNTGGQSSTPVTPGSQPATSTLTGALTGLHMINATVGWAVSWDIAGTGNSYHILRTTDAGVHWKVVLQCTSTQGAGKGFIVGCVTDFHSASVATVLAPEFDSATQESQSRIFHTSDGGQTWQSSVVKARYIETPAVFVDAQHGWFLATDHFPGYDPGSAYIGKEIALYRTVDGGKSWQRVASGPATSQLPATSDDAYGIVPLTAATRMQFVTATTGWLAGTSFHKDQSEFSWLYVTHDAGTTWQQVDISLPPQSLLLWPPRFFTQQDGLLSALTSGPAPQYAPGTLLYTTHDGGLTWTATAVPFDVTNGEFLDMNNAWASAVNGNDKAFYTTSDGWRHWTKGHMDVTFNIISGFSFVSPGIGWALAYNRTKSLPEPGGGLRKGDSIALLKTTDGGQTWQEIAHSVV